VLLVLVMLFFPDGIVVTIARRLSKFRWSAWFAGAKRGGTP